MKYAEFIELAKANYTKGGDSYYECWDEDTFNEYEEMFGKMTKKRALAMFKDNAAVTAEYEAAAEWYGGMDQETIDIINKENAEYEARKKAEEEKEMANSAQVQVIEIEVEGVKFTQTRPGYYYKRVDGKNVRIPKNEWEQAFEAYTATVDEADEVEEEPKVKKTRRSKDVAFEHNTIKGNITLTAKQVDFLKALPGTCFWENGLESTLWCDCIAEEIGWNPMSVGAMISTLREKGLVSVGQETSRQGKPKFMTFTIVGQVIAEHLGLK